MPPEKPIVLTPADTDVLKDGRKLSEADEKAFIDAANRGNAEYTVRYSPVGEDEVYFKIVVSGGKGPKPPPVPDKPVTPDTPVLPVVDPTTKPTSAVYVYEKDQNAVPSAVMSGLNRLNREKKIIATVFEDDSTNGKSGVPEQYKAAYEAAKKEGLPVLVITAGDKVLKTIKAPKTEAEVFEAVK